MSDNEGPTIGTEAASEQQVTRAVKDICEHIDAAEKRILEAMAFTSQDALDKAVKRALEARERETAAQTAEGSNHPNAIPAPSTDHPEATDTEIDMPTQESTEPESTGGPQTASERRIMAKVYFMEGAICRHTEHVPVPLQKATKYRLFGDYISTAIEHKRQAAASSGFAWSGAASMRVAAGDESSGVLSCDAEHTKEVYATWVQAWMYGGYQGEAGVELEIDLQQR